MVGRLFFCLYFCANALFPRISDASSTRLRCVGLVSHLGVSVWLIVLPRRVVRRSPGVICVMTPFVVRV